MLVDLEREGQGDMNPVLAGVIIGAVIAEWVPIQLRIFRCPRGADGSATGSHRLRNLKF